MDENFYAVFDAKSSLPQMLRAQVKLLIVLAE